jgi:hypothetical protein
MADEHPDILRRYQQIHEAEASIGLLELDEAAEQVTIQQKYSQLQQEIARAGIPPQA